MENLIAYEFDKEKIADEILTDKTGFILLFKKEFAGLCISFYFKGVNVQQTSDFLGSYLKDFKDSAKDENVQIYFNCPMGELSNPNLLMWNDWPYEIVYNEKNRTIIERDFVLKESIEGNSFFVIGPQMSIETCDIIDNLLIYTISKNLLDVDALLLHSACVSDGKFAYVFFGASGAGKSTISEFLNKDQNLSVISSDQLIIKLTNGQLVAYSTPTTIPEFHLDHLGREKRPMPIRSIVHLVQSENGFHFKKIDDNLWLKYFMRELIYRAEFKNSSKLLELSIKIMNNKLIFKGEMSYPKGESFWIKFLSILES
jgi:hypothetical protein